MKDLIKYVVFRLTPHLIFDKIVYFFSKQDKAFLSEIQNERNAYVFLGCDYSNLGDYAITLAQKKLLQDILSDRKVHVIKINQTYTRLKAILKKHETSELVTIIGGGNMGDLYYGYERKRNFIVHKMHEYKIISFPQSLIFSSSPFGILGLRRSSKEYSYHHDLLILAREELSYTKMLSYFESNRIVLCPDIVLTLDMRKKNIRSNIVLTLRNDHEGILSLKDKERILFTASELGLKVFKLDTSLDNNSSNDDNFNHLLDIYSKSQLVITDRLHGMIFSYITGTPAIVFPNNNGKIEYSYKWISDCGYIKLIQKSDIDHLKDFILERKDYQIDNILFMKKRKCLLEYFKKIVKS